MIADTLPDVWAVLPVKRLDLAKQRLAPVLSNAERMMLVRTMLHDVLMTLAATPELRGIIVVSSDRLAEELAKQFNARIVSDLSESGVNDAIRQGMKFLDPKAAVLVVPADVPFAAVSDLQAVIANLRQHPVVLAPASSDGGTNVLAMRSADLIAPSFGEDSYARHQAQARQKNLSCGVVRSDGLGHDIDRPEDLFVSATPKKNSLTSALLAEFDIAARLDALQSS
jgi:2-phospho-L-lactate guanylyltransferase